MGDGGVTAVIRQELANISGQLLEMQATMMLWMSQQADTAVEQQKKTLPLPTKYAAWPYGLPQSRPGFPPANNRPSTPSRRNETSGRRGGL